MFETPVITDKPVFTCVFVVHTELGPIHAQRIQWINGNRDLLVIVEDTPPRTLRRQAVLATYYHIMEHVSRPPVLQEEPNAMAAA